MFEALRFVVRIVEGIVALFQGSIRLAIRAIDCIPQIPRWLRYITFPILSYVLLTLILVYPYAFIRGWTGQAWHTDVLKYASERWLATALYDAKGRFVGTFDPRMDSKRDVNYTALPIELPGDDYIASPDHKSIPVRAIPEHYWQCLKYHEDRRLGSALNPFGIDFYGVLKIPYSTLKRSISSRRLHLGVGGSTIPMQLVRAIYKLTPSRGEGVSGKISRKFMEWWYAPVIYRALSRNGDHKLLKRWAADHLPLAQRTGGPPLYGVEQTSRVVFGKPASSLTKAEQFVLAGAVNHPIILLPGSKRLNRVRLDAWRKIILVRAHKCAITLLDQGSAQIEVIAELDKLADGPPDPRVPPKINETLLAYAPKLAKRARANPILRAHILAPAIRYGVRKEMEDIYGFDWRDYVRGVNLTLDVSENLRFRERVKTGLAKLQKRYQTSINHPFSLNMMAASKDGNQSVPDIVVVAANAKGEIVRYFDSGYSAPYFGSWNAFNRETGGYEPNQESRAIASIGKMLAAIAIANVRKDTLDTLYIDTNAPERGLESCRRRGGLRRGRRAEVVFACSLSNPLEKRLAGLGQEISGKLARNFGFTMPPNFDLAEETPASTAIVRGHVTASPRTVHRMAGTILASLIGRANKPLELPHIIKRFDLNIQNKQVNRETHTTDIVIPGKLIRSDARTRLMSFLSAPLCYAHRGRKHGTLKSLSDWCAARRKDIRLHFAKTGTHVNLDHDATVDVWVAGGIQFANGSAYSYVVLLGTGNSTKPFAQRLHAADLAAPLARILLKDLSEHAKKRSRTTLSHVRP